MEKNKLGVLLQTHHNASMTKVTRERLSTGHLRITTTSPEPSSDPKLSLTPSSSLNMEASLISTLAASCFKKNKILTKIGLSSKLMSIVLKNHLKKINLNQRIDRYLKKRINFLRR